MLIRRHSAQFANSLGVGAGVRGVSVASVIGKLNALAVTRASKPGNYGDGGSLHLHVSATGAKSWIFRYKLTGRSREMGLGSLITLSLADARKVAGECRKLTLERIDPIEKRKADRQAAEAETAKAKTFKECAEAYIAINRPGWKNPKHAAQWPATMEMYAYPVIGHLAAAAVETGLVLDILEPIWSVKNETASRIRGRVEAVLDWAKVKGCRIGDNPARFRGAFGSGAPKAIESQKGGRSGDPHAFDRLVETM